MENFIEEQILESMDHFFNKLGPHGDLVYRAFDIFRDCNMHNRPPAFEELQLIAEAAEAIVSVLGSSDGLTQYEFDVLVGHAAHIEPTMQLPFLDAVVDIILAVRPADELTEYDQKFLEVVAWIHAGLANAQGANMGEYLSPELIGDNSMQQIDIQGLVPFDGIPQTPGINLSEVSNTFNVFSTHAAVPEAIETNADFPGFQDYSFLGQTFLEALKESLGIPNFDQQSNI